MELRKPLFPLRRTNGTNGTTKPPRYSALSLLRHGLDDGPWPRVWRTVDLERSYDVVIIGAGVHGLATSYYLASRHGVTRVAVVDKGYVGGGGSGRNTTMSEGELSHA